MFSQRYRSFVCGAEERLFTIRALASAELITDLFLCTHNVKYFTTP